jgi:hypothetical protein
MIVGKGFRIRRQLVRQEPPLQISATIPPCERGKSIAVRGVHAIVDP